MPDLFLLARVLGQHTRVTRLYSHLLPDHLARARNAVQLSAPTDEGAKAKAARPAPKAKSPKAKTESALSSVMKSLPILPAVSRWIGRTVG